MKQENTGSYPLPVLYSFTQRTFLLHARASSCMGAWWSPYMVATAESLTLTSMAITPPESATTSYNANIQQSSATQLPVHFSRKCFPGAQGFGAEPLRAICGNCANLSPANANKTPRGPSTKDSDATGLIKRPEINTKTSLPREHEQVLEPQRR